MAQSHAHDDHDAHSPAHYVKIWVVLLVLLVISIVGPEVSSHMGAAGIYVLLFTAFGIAFVKAWLVIKHFMHLTVEKSFVGYILITCLIFLVLFLAGTAADVHNHTGTNWVNYAAIDEIARVEAEHAGGGAHGEDSHGATTTDQVEETPAVEEPEPKEAAPAAAPKTFADMKTDAEKKGYLMKRGEKLYTTADCVTCHRSNGAGHGPFPTLIGQQVHMGDCATTIGIIVNGMTGPIEVNGATYDQPMPPARDISKEDAAAIATYVRNSWGNDYGICTP